MDEYTGKRAAGMFGSRGGSSLSFKDPNQGDRNIQYCSRSGCSSWLNSMKGTRAGNREKMTHPKAPFRSTSRKAIDESSSRSFSCPSNFRKTLQEQKNRMFLRETGVAEINSRAEELEHVRYRNRRELIEDSDSNNIQQEIDDSEVRMVASSIQTALPDSEELESVIHQGVPANTAEPFDSCTATSSLRPRKQLNQRVVGSSKQDTSGSSVRRSSISRNTTGPTKPISQGVGAGAPRYGFKNIGCTSMSNVLQSGCSSESGHCRRISSERKRLCDGGSSSTGAGTSKSSAGGHSGSLGRSLSGLPRERSFSQQTSRRARNQPANRDSAVSVRTRRPPGEETRITSPDQDVNNTVTPFETLTVIPQLPQNQISIPEYVPESLLRSSPAESPALFFTTFGRSGTSSRSARTRSSTGLEDNSSQIFRGPPEDRDILRRVNMEGIAELRSYSGVQQVLLAIERIEQDDELSYEQLLILETNLFLGGLSFHDQHRDMRMDIDNMSYEELLALEEKMGTVSTALPEEALAKCLKRSIYAPATMLTGIISCGDDDIKCSICQEEYAVGDELGKLACQHCYHLACIDQWLRQKNRCPICKATVSSS